MSFWNNPENNSLKTLLVVVLVVIVGFFVYKSMHKSSTADTGRVIDAVATQPAPAVSSPQGVLVFSEAATGNTCTVTVADPANASNSITVAGTAMTDKNGKTACVPNPKQANMGAQGMVSAMMAH